MKMIQFKTNFPKHPKERWEGWTGYLSAGDEIFIFTQEVYTSLFKLIFYRFLSKGFDYKKSEEMTADLLGELGITIKKKCEQKILIQKSIGDLIFGIIHRLFLHKMCKSNQLKNCMEENMDDMDYFCSSIEDLVIGYNRKELIFILESVLFELPKDDQELIIQYYFKNMTLKELAFLYNTSMDKIRNKKDKAEKKLKGFLLEKGYKKEALI